MTKKLQLPSWVNPDRHIIASKLFPYRNYDHTQRWKTNYGIQAHKIIPEKEGWQTDNTNHIYKIPEFDVTVGYRIDGKNDNCIFELKDSVYFKKNRLDCVIQANFYKIAENYNDCQIVTYPTPKTISSKPSRITYHKIPQYTRNEIIKMMEPFLRHINTNLKKLECYR